MWRSRSDRIHAERVFRPGVNARTPGVEWSLNPTDWSHDHETRTPRARRRCGAGVLRMHHRNHHDHLEPRRTQGGLPVQPADRRHGAGRRRPGRAQRASGGRERRGRQLRGPGRGHRVRRALGRHRRDELPRGRGRIEGHGAQLGRRAGPLRRPRDRRRRRGGPRRPEGGRDRSADGRDGELVRSAARPAGRRARLRARAGGRAVRHDRRRLLAHAPDHGAGLAVHRMHQRRAGVHGRDPDRCRDQPRELRRTRS